LIEPAIEYDHNDLTVEKVIQRLSEDSLRGLVVLDDDFVPVAFQTMELVQEGDVKILNLVTTAGDRLDEWVDELEQALEVFACDWDCDVIQTRGRPGWFKKLKKYGYEPLFFVAQKRVEQ
jgi:hypothetical protein